MIASGTTSAGEVAMLATRYGRRSSAVPGGDGPTRIVRVDPADGARGVFRDAPVVAVLSRPLDAPSVTEDAFGVFDCAGPVPGRLETSPDRHVLVWVGQRLLTPGVEHHVRALGLQDARGRWVDAHESTFVTCDVTLADLST